MKKGHLVGLIAMAVAAAMLVYALGDASSYVTFAAASKQPEREFHIVGTFAKGKPIYYDALKDPNYLEFYLTDRDGRTARVIYHQPKPQDFERAEEVVIIGKIQDDSTFLASKILTKCPSKYVENDLSSTAQSP